MGGPGGVTAAGMISDDVPETVWSTLLEPAVKGPPICFLCPPESGGLTEARIVARECESRLQDYRQARADRRLASAAPGQAPDACQ